MDFLNKLQDTAKSAGNVIGDGAKAAAAKASDSLEIMKIKGKISEENKSIDEEMRNIGEYFFEKIDSGELADENAQLHVDAIKQHRERIEDLQREIEAVKAE